MSALWTLVSSFIIAATQSHIIAPYSWQHFTILPGVRAPQTNENHLNSRGRWLQYLEVAPDDVPFAYVFCSLSPLHGLCKSMQICCGRLIWHGLQCGHCVSRCILDAYACGLSCYLCVFMCHLSWFPCCLIISLSCCDDRLLIIIHMTQGYSYSFEYCIFGAHAVFVMEN